MTLSQRIGSYELGVILGRGATGEVHQAVRIGSSEQYAIKMLRSELAGSPDLIARFLQERSILCRLKHPNIVQVHDLVIEGGSAAIVMDLVEGSDLRHVLDESGTLSPSDAARLIVQLLSALTAVHAMGIVHRDIKPENVLAASDGWVKLTDFGIARLTNGPGITQMPGLFGTRDYIAPELAEQHPATPAADVYSTGILCYELVSGFPPFSGEEYDEVVLHRHTHEEPRRPAGIPDALWDLLTAMLAKEPTNRPTVVEARDRLVTMAPELDGLSAVPPNRPDRATGSSMSEALPRTSRHEQETIHDGESMSRESGIRLEESGSGRIRRTRTFRHRFLVIAIALVVLTAGVGVAVAVHLTGSPETPRTAAPSGRLVFEDSFADPKSGWAPDAGQDGAGMANYFKGGYQVAVLKPLPALHTFSVASPYERKLPELAVTVDSTFLKAAPSDGAGVRCDVDARRAVRYTFEIHANGSWQIFRLGGPGVAVIAQGTNAAIRTGNRTNSVTAECSQLPNAETSLVMAVNGETVGRATNSPGGGVTGWHSALVVYRSATSRGTVTRFTDFRAYDASGT
jgi:serine/threonine protein kinase